MNNLSYNYLICLDKLALEFYVELSNTPIYANVKLKKYKFEEYLTNSDVDIETCLFDDMIKWILRHCVSMKLLALASTNLNYPRSVFIDILWIL